VIRGARQLRVIPGAVIGFDLGAMMTMGTALGVPPLAAAELLPEIEATAVQKMNERLDRG